MTDNSPMPFGEHKGKAMVEVPASYLMFISIQAWITKWPEVHGYIKDNMDVLKSQTKSR